MITSVCTGGQLGLEYWVPSRGWGQNDKVVTVTVINLPLQKKLNFL